MVLRVGYIREHFASPLLQFATVDNGSTFKLVECPGGTGQIISAFKNDEIDVGIALTDALISGIANGNPDYLLAGQYVTTPLNWAVIVGKDSKYQKLGDLRGTTIGISRVGSGSQTMAAVMAMQQGWFTDDAKTDVEKFQFKVNNNIDGLIASVNDGSTSAFMWEWFTTKPYADKGLVRFIGSVPTPWPSWMVAAHTSSTRAPEEQVRDFLVSLTGYVRKFAEGLPMTTPTILDISPAVKVEQETRKKENARFIMDTFGYEEEDVLEWMSQHSYPKEVGEVDLSVVVRTLEILEKAGVVKRPAEGFNPEKFVNGKIARFGGDQSVVYGKLD